jgi:hypothetical protein
MTKTRQAPAAWLLLVLILVASMPSPAAEAAETAEARMTRGKLAADLGDPRTAAQLFADVAADAAVSANARAEALVRLGVVQRTLGKTQASAEAFEAAMQSRARDAEVTRLVTLAIAGVAPDRTRWATQWGEVKLASPSASAKAQPAIVWPGPGPEGVRQAFPAAEPVTLALDDVPLIAFLHHLLTPWRPGDKSCAKCNWPGPRTTPGFESWPESYQPPAPVLRLDLVIHSGVQGHRAADILDPRSARVTVKASKMPWNELFENVLASNGLGFVLDKGLLFIARVEDIGAYDHIRGRAYGGPPVTFNMLDGRLGEVLGLFGDVTGMRIVPDAESEGAVTLVVTDRPAMQVLDLVLAGNDLAPSLIEAHDAKPGRLGLRIRPRADVKRGVVDLSKLMPAVPGR